jgi:EAL domain-containing protein (putative c-di-GMP-specific phosphodiesterase class I)
MDVQSSPRADSAPLDLITPSTVPDAGVLYLGPPGDESRTALREYLRSAGVSAGEPFPGILAVPLTPGLLQNLAADLADAPSETLLHSTRVLVASHGESPSLIHLVKTLSLAALLSGVRGRWLAELLCGDRLVSHFQPIVRATDPTAVFGHECLVRGLTPNGGLVPPRDLFTAARGAGMLSHLDRAARQTAIRSAARAGAGGHLFVNFNASSLHAPGYCLRHTVEAVAEAGLDPARMVFEVVEDEEVRDTGWLVEALRVYRWAGFGVALDDVGAGYNSLNLLAHLRPDFVKLDMGLVRGVDRDRYKARVAGKMLELARDLGVRAVVEGVETPGEWEWARSAGADFLQGYLFARPAPLPTRTSPSAIVA